MTLHIHAPKSLTLRTRTLSLAAACLALLALGACDSSTQTKAPPKAPEQSKTAPGTEPTVSVSELMKEGPLAEHSLGKADAPITIIEYASMTCGHCATFHNDAAPYLKEKYIDKGLVRLIYREFPLDPLAYAGSLLARCAGDGKYFPMLDLMFKQQRIWAYAEHPETALLNVVKQAGFSKESFDTCLQDQNTYDALKQVRQRASEVFGVNSTPTFFINGKIHRGAMTPQQIDAELAPFVAAISTIKK